MNTYMAISRIQNSGEVIKSVFLSNGFSDQITISGHLYKRTSEIGWLHWDFLVDNGSKIVGFSVYKGDVDVAASWTVKYGIDKGDMIDLLLPGADVSRAYNRMNEQAFGSQVYIPEKNFEKTLNCAIVLTEWSEDDFSFSNII
jgi:hypothetical protein